MKKSWIKCRHDVCDNQEMARALWWSVGNCLKLRNEMIIICNGKGKYKI